MKDDNVVWLFGLLLLIMGIILSIELQKVVKQQQLLNCIKSVDGTDAECDSCYYMIYGEFPKSK